MRLAWSRLLNSNDKYIVCSFRIFRILLGDDLSSAAPYIHSVLHLPACGQVTKLVSHDFSVHGFVNSLCINSFSRFGVKCMI